MVHQGDDGQPPDVVAHSKLTDAPKNPRNEDELLGVDRRGISTPKL